VPSFDVNTQPISDAATIVRPANVRGLSPDNVLVLVNGKRRHRGSIISFLGGGISDGAQGVDISAIPSMALKQVEVLRDGASSQYGSDAIAGVLNFILRDDDEGFEVKTKWGSTFEGDGDNYILAANAGFSIGGSGFVNVTGEIREVDGTVRSVVRDDVAGMVE
jgi:iron complex outermembrane receptor protein